MSSLELPPRRHLKGQEMTIRRNRTSLEILLQMGFPKHRAEKALAATGDKGVQLACDWLLSHVRDPALDETKHREYILYVCPVGPLQQELLDFWQKSFRECGWNRAHNYFPHITLCSFFQASNSLVSNLSHAIKHVAEKLTATLDKLEFDYFASANFIGLFVTETYARVLKKLTLDFVEEMKKSGVVVELHKKQLHISLAYQFQSEKKKEKLESLAKAININLPARWDLRLYSRDKARDNCQVRRVLYTHIPRVSDELELCDRDFIFVKESELESNTDGWFEGISWMTGCSGMFPGAYTERTAETETWVLHRSIPIFGLNASVQSEQVGPSQWTTDQNNAMLTSLVSPTPESTYLDRKSLMMNVLSSPLEAIMETNEIIEKPGTIHRHDNDDSLLGSGEKVMGVKEDCYGPLPDVATSHSQLSKQPANLESVQGRDSNDNSSNRCLGRNKAISTLGNVSTKGPRQLFVVRHGERVDFTFGKNWIQYCFNQNGEYIRYDLNMPGSVPKRKAGPSGFSQDSPITVQGQFQARLLGEAMLEKQIEISHVYSSPSLRCVETATSIMEGLKLKKEISVEPGLFEWLSWFQEALPDFMPPSELSEAGYPVKVDYQPVWTMSKYNVSETIEQFYERSYLVTKEILKRHEGHGGSLLFVSHGINLDSCTRQLIGQSVRSPSAFHEILQKIPYCAVAAAQEATVVRDTWYLIEPPVLPFAHTSNARYNWTLLTQPTVL